MRCLWVISCVVGLGSLVSAMISPEPRPDSSVASAQAIPIHFRLEHAGYVTLVIDNANGERVRNLLASTQLPAGENTVWWDGYDEGARNAAGDRVRHRVPAGTYRVRGLTHDGIHARYEFSVNSPGCPPWKTSDGSGGWLADHTPPADILYLPPHQGAALGGPGKGQLLVCSSSGEAGDEFVWLTEEGRRLTGFNTGFWGGMFLARDEGPQALAAYAAYTLISGERDPDNDTIEVRAFCRGGRSEQDVLPIIKVTFPHQAKRFKTVADGYGNNGLAVYNGLVVFSFTQFDKLVLVDARRKKVVGEVKVSTPRGLRFDPQGRLYVLSGKRLERFALDAQKPTLTHDKTIIAAQLDDPRRVTMDARGQLYIADWGKSHQVKVFSPSGRWVRTIGRPGGPQLGHYDEQRMSHPAGMTCDGQGRLWVAEAEYMPKRLSVWSAAGVFERAYYGPPMYGGGGAIDPYDKSRFYYAEWFKNGGMEFHLDWDKGAASPQAVYWRPERFPDQVPGPAGQQAIHVHGQTYLTNCYNGDLRFNQDRGTTIWRLDADQVARPVAVLANVADMNGPHGWSFRNKQAINALWRGHDESRIWMVWSDRNHNQTAEPDEVQWVEVPKQPGEADGAGGPGLQARVHADLSVTSVHGMRLAPPRLDSQGVPIYDLHSITRVGRTDVLRPPVSTRSWVLSTVDGPDLVAALVGSRVDGKRPWRINAQPEQVVPAPGELAALTRLLGPPVKPRQGEAGPLVAVNGEMGSIFLVTMDGLVIGDLGGDARLKPYWRMLRARRGIPIEGISFEQEHFHPSISQTADGMIYLVAGFNHSSILHLTGWQTIRRCDFGTVLLGEPAAAARPPTRIEAHRQEARRTLSIALRERAPRVDGRLDDWPASTQWASIGDRARAALLISGGRLFVAFRTSDPNALHGGTGDFRRQFKRGGALDLMLGTDPGAERRRHEPVAGDLRLLITLVDGKQRAVLYRAVAPAANREQAVTYQSPIAKVVFQQVLNVSAAVDLAQQGGDFELSIPLRVLGLKAEQGSELLGDIGWLRGDGQQTVQRLYWNNNDTLTVSDLPSEARLQPAHWGLWKFR